MVRTHPTRRPPAGEIGRLIDRAISSGAYRSLRDLEAATGVDHSTIAQARNGRTMPSPESCRRLAPALGVAADELLAMAGYRPSPPAVADRPPIDQLDDAIRRILLAAADLRRQRLAVGAEECADPGDMVTQIPGHRMIERGETGANVPIPIVAAATIDDLRRLTLDGGTEVIDVLSLPPGRLRHPEMAAVGYRLADQLVRGVPDGSTLLVEPCAEPRLGDRLLVVAGGRALVATLSRSGGRLALVPPDAAVGLPMTEAIEVLGRVVARIDWYETSMVS